MDRGRRDSRGGLSPKTVRNIHQILRKALEREPDTGLYYNLACMEARLGRHDEAIEHLGHVVNEQRFRELAPNDPDLESLRDDPRFATLLETS